jgi:hypothetical protein
VRRPRTFESRARPEQSRQDFQLRRPLSFLEVRLKNIPVRIREDYNDSPSADKAGLHLWPLRHG